MLIDARDVSADTNFACDLCVVGAGPAGIAIVDRLRSSNLSIVLVESGGFDPELSTQRLYRGENIGEPYYQLDECRFRLFGGSSNRWGGWCRPLETSDYEHRPWMPWSGWPISDRDLASYHADVARLLELDDASFDLDSVGDRFPEPFPLAGTDFQSVFFRYSPETNFGERYRAQLLAAPNVTTLIHANLTQIDLAPGTNRIGALRIRALDGAAFSVRPRAVVLATGGIENARILLASRHERPAGLGNEHDLVGRFFMEHLHVPAGHMVAETGAAGRRFYRKAVYDGLRIRGVVTPTASAVGRRQLPSTSIAVEPASYSYGTPFLSLPPAVTFGPVLAFRKLRDSRIGPLVKSLKRNAERLAGIPLRLQTWNDSRMAKLRGGATEGRLYSLYFRSEQAPDPASRVFLSDRTDALGMPRVTFDWRISALDLAAVTGWLEHFDRTIRSSGVGRVVPPVEGWQRRIIGGPHHLGTTRMASGPRSGVVDESCRVHSVDNLYVAGGSVFATSGYANPTFTVVALALRLADTLRKRLHEPYILSSDVDQTSH